MSAPRPVLITRPAPGAEASAARASALGLEALLYPLFAIEALAWTPPAAEDFDALLLTSANAPRRGGAALDRYCTLPVFAVGDATARAATERGFATVTTSGPDAQATLQAIARAGHRRILHLCGEDVRPVKAGTLALHRIPVYRAAPAGDGPGLAARLDRSPVVLAHSPRAGARIAALIPPERRATLDLVGISPATLEAAGGGWHRALAPDSPKDSMMLALARQICQ